MTIVIAQVGTLLEIAALKAPLEQGLQSKEFF